MTSSSILDGARARFDASTDFTIGLEEEYQLLDPATMSLVNRFEEVMEAAPDALRARLAGELIASELEFKTHAHTTFAGAARELVEGRLACAALLESQGLQIGTSGVHPFSPWQEQRIIDTPHYRLVEGDLGYIAWTNNTWSIHLHCGVHGADRAIRIVTAMRSFLPELLALSANSPIFLGRDTRLASMRTQIFTKSFPRCGIHDGHRDWDDYARHVRFLEETGSIVESTQIWWSVRPHHAFGTVEVRILDGQCDMRNALGLTALALAYIARLCADDDAGMALPFHPRGLIDENMWRAQRYGIDAELIDLDSGEVVPLRELIARRLAWTAGQRKALGLEPYIAFVQRMLDEGNGAALQRHLFDTNGGDAVALQREIARHTLLSAQELLPQLPAPSAASGAAR